MNKRLLRSMAALMSVAIVLSAGITQAFAATADEDGYTKVAEWTDTTDVPSAKWWIGSTGTDKTGIAGKSEDDKSILLAYNPPASGTHNGRVYVTAGNLSAAATYYVCELNAMFVNTEIALRGSNNEVIGSTIKTNDGKWHKVLWYIDVTGGPKGDLTNDTYPTYAYVDGVYVGTTNVSAKNVQGNNTGKLECNTRLGMYNAKADSKAYLDDIHIYSTNVLPTAAKTASASLGGDGVTVDGNKVVLPSGSTLADVATANAANLDVRAYTNDKMLAELSDTEILRTGYTLVTEDKETKALKYYTIDMGDGYVGSFNSSNDPVSKLTFPTAGTSGAGTKENLAEIETVTAIAGKASDDESILLKYRAVQNAGNTHNGRVYVSTGNMNADADYYVCEANIKCENTEIALRGSNNEVVGGTFSTKDGKWHKIIWYVDLSGGPKSDVTNDTYNAYMFMDGAQVANNTVTAKNMQSSNTDKFEFNTRLGMYGATAESKAYLDDIHIYATNVQPTAEQSGAEALVRPADVEVNGKVVTIPKGSTLEAIKEANSDKLNIRAYTSSAMTEIVPDSVVIGRGYVIVAEDKQTKALSYYDIQRRKGNFDIEIDNVNGTSAELVIVNKESERSVVVVVTAWDGEKYVAKTVTRYSLAVSNDEQTFTLNYSSLGGENDTIEIAVWDYSGAYPKNLGEEISQYQR